MSEHDAGERDPALDRWLAEAREGEAAPAADIASMLSNVELEIAGTQERPSSWLRSRSTLVRRIVAILAVLLVVIVGGVIVSRRELGATPLLHLLIALGALGTLLGVGVHQALRPLHEPALSSLARGAFAVLTIGATFALALLPVHGVHTPLAGQGLLEHVSPCLFYGLGIGLPVLFVLRVLDRGGRAGLLAACAAGLAGNLVLELHCPRADAEHLMLGHFTVALLFVAGIGLVHLATRARAR